MVDSISSCVYTHAPLCSNSSCVGNSSQLGILGSKPTNITCQIYFTLGRSALQCPRLPSTVGPTPSSLAQSFTAMSLEDPQEHTWYPNSGASSHMTLFDDNLACKSTYNGSTKVIVGNGAISHIGDCCLHTTTEPLRLTSIYHVPELK